MWAVGPAGCSSCPRSRSSGRRSAEHCRTAWLRGRFLARGSLSLAGGHAHLEFVVTVEEAAELARRLDAVGLPAAWRVRRGHGVVTWKSAESITTFLGRIGASASLLELEARQVARSLRGELNRVLNAESANLQRSVAASGRQLAAIDALEADGRLGEQPRTVRAVAAARRETPEASLSEIAARLDLHRSAVQRALDRLERLALHDDEGVGRRVRTRRGRRGEPQPAGDGDRSLTADGPVTGHGRGRRLWHDQVDAPDRDRRQLEDEHDARPMRGSWPARSRRAPGRPASPGSSARRSCACAAVRDALAGEDVGVGAQNVHHELAGAFTGEVSAPMLAGLATWVILGHSERRAQFGETDDLIGRKLDRAVAAGLRPILCVGEVLAEREAGREVAVVDGQLRGSLDGRDPGALVAAGLVIAYEPVWAIGTGRNALGADAAAMADAIRAGARATSAGARPPTTSRCSTAAASRPPTSGSSSPSPRSTARSWAGRRSSPTRWPGSSPGPASPRRPGASPGDGARPGEATPAARPRPIVLVVLDGFGIGPRPGGRRDRGRAHAPLARRCSRAGPTASSQASEGAVGLPPGQMGNSEVGHLNLGAGRPGAPGPAADRRGDRGRLVRRAAGAARRLRASPR